MEIKKECQKNERQVFMRQYNKNDRGKNLVVLLFHKNLDLIKFYQSYRQRFDSIEKKKLNNFNPMVYKAPRKYGLDPESVI
jgi:hypothetical protein